MRIKVSVTSEELNEMGQDEISLTEHIIEALDSCQDEMVGYDVDVVID